MSKKKMTVSQELIEKLEQCKKERELEKRRKPKTVKLVDPNTFETTERVIPNEYIYPLDDDQLQVINALISILQPMSYAPVEGQELLQRLFEIRSRREYDSSDRDMIENKINIHRENIKRYLKDTK